MGQWGHPRRDVTVMYATWTVATLAVAGYGLASSSWQLMVACLVFNALETAGTIIWATIKQRHVPASMLGRVSSLDWLISIGLLPLSFALTAPVGGAHRSPGDAGRRRGYRRRCHVRRALHPGNALHRGCRGERATSSRRQRAVRRSSLRPPAFVDV